MLACCEAPFRGSFLLGLLLLGLICPSFDSHRLWAQDSGNTAENSVESAAESSTAIAAQSDSATPSPSDESQPTPVPPQASSTAAEKLAEAARWQALQDRVAAAELAGHNAWMLTASALVLFMTIPGLAMFYGGLVRKKNVLSVLMQCIFLAGIMTVVWAVVGYSLAFGEGNPFIGNFSHWGLQGVVMDNGEAPLVDGIPVLTFAVFQGMFFIITPALICGAFAERMKFSAMVLFSVLWGLLIYCPLCHWVWGDGILAYGEPHAIAGGALDFAGGTVVHISSGVAALLCAIQLKPRLGLGTEEMRPHNLTYTVLGAGMLWVGWFGFNAGSQLGSDGQAASAFVVTHLSAAAGAVAWAGYEWLTRGKASALGAASGAVAGLVCITPAAGFVQPMPALVMGGLAGITCYLACSQLKSRFKFDDALDAFGIHGVGGALGAMLTGVFATAHLSADVPNGLWYDLSSGAVLLWGQLIAVVISVLFVAVGTQLLLVVLDLTMGLRVTEEEELQGLDFSLHGEEGYIG